MRRVLALVLPLALLAACAGAEKRGDRAAAVGDWKSAERQYAEALRKDPNDAEKRAKHQQARAQALQAAAAAQAACVAARDWECAFAEADYVVRLEPGDAGWATARAEAARNVGSLRLRQAADASARGDHGAAFDLHARGRDVSNDPGVAAEAARVAPVVVGGAVGEAGRLRAAQRYPQAIELLTLAAGLDGRVRPQLDAVRAEYDRWLDAQYEGEAQQGDALLRERRFSEAQARYEAAQRFRKGGRAEPLGRYARALAAGERAVARRDWPGATAAYEEAVRTGVDASRLAAVELERVRVRPYAIRVRTVLVKPVRPDGAPWAGGRSRGFDRMVGLLASAAFDRAGAGARGALDVYDALPHENRPSLVASLVLPDGREFATPARKAIRARLESSVVVDANAYDDRPVSVRVFHDDPRGRVEVGAVTFRLMDVVAGELDLADRAVLELRVVAEPSPLRDGESQGFVAVAPPPRPGRGPAPAGSPAR
jgi:tetratricopeptide (TPR) repeat protein